ncbi:MAG: PhoH family protein [Acidobacteriota bacterium]
MGPPSMGKLTLSDAGIASLFGSHDHNLKRIERAFGVRLAARGSQITVEGGDAVAPAVATVERMLTELSEVAARGQRIRQEHVRTAIRVLQQDPEMSLVDFFYPPDETLAAVCQRVAPRSLNQHSYLRAMLDHDIVIADGPAGTGKTFLAVAMASVCLTQKKVRRIVLARPAVEAGEKLGFLPGDLAEKVNPYLRPLHDALHDLLGYEKVARMMERGIIEVAPIAFMRGRTLNDSFVILDEAQNTTSEQMKMFLTRMGFGSKVVVNGDVTQIDLPTVSRSGLRRAQQVLSGVDGIAFVHFEKQDVVRHSLVQKIVAAYDVYEQAGSGMATPSADASAAIEEDLVPSPLAP